MKNSLENPPVNQPESAPEIHPNRENILEAIGRLMEGGKIVNEKSDEAGPYLIEVRFDGKEGEYTQYEYMRRGNFPGSHNSSGTSINVVHYDSNDFPCGGENMANFSYEIQQWEDA